MNHFRDWAKSKVVQATALEIIEGLEKMNQKWQSERRPTLNISVGISTGEMLIGNIGSTHL